MASTIKGIVLGLTLLAALIFLGQYHEAEVTVTKQETATPSPSPSSTLSSLSSLDARRIRLMQQMIEDRERRRRTALARQSSNDPRSPDYDAEVVSILTPGSGVLRQIWEREPRDEAWAKATELQMLEPLVADFNRWMPKVNVIDVECRTASCKVTIRSTTHGMGRESIRNLITFSGLTPAGSTHQWDIENAPDGGKSFVVYGVFSREVRNDYPEFLAQARRGLLNTDRLREAVAKGP